MKTIPLFIAYLGQDLAVPAPMTAAGGDRLDALKSQISAE
jgi:hypothetical protein